MHAGEGEAVSAAEQAEVEEATGATGDSGVTIEEEDEGIHSSFFFIQSHSAS